ncbi:hypothetical protein [Corynebacterium ulceribovis]|uniref:hypothetical protein n=1 Tax=Corynebacterium ulceribovis TaxID=487732 RepID=UPI00037ABA37|nr:hypothetical protein [Corynebacterium ulceribovis]
MDRDIRDAAEGQCEEQRAELRQLEPSHQLSEADVQRIRDFVRNCPECLETLGAELRLRRLLRRGCCPEAAPPQLAQRLSLQVRRAAQQVQFREYRSHTTITRSSADGAVTSRVIVQRSERSIVQYHMPDED